MNGGCWTIDVRKLGRALASLGLAVCLAACTNIQKPTPEPFIALTAPPPKQEFRWSNGKLPKSFDPARAAAAPETDVARALYEGLTEIDPQTLEAKPALAEKWTSEDQRVWIFHLRRDARWSNGKRVSAGDVSASWRRLLQLGDKAAHPLLTQNIVGFKKQDLPGALPIPEFDLDGGQNNVPPPLGAITQTPALSPDATPQPAAPKSSPKPNETSPIGVEAIDDTTLKVTLVLPDKDLPKLVADPMFFPVYDEGKQFETEPDSASMVTNGAFKLTLVGKDGIYMERSETYWDKAAVSLERVRMVLSDNAENALNSYKSGELDAVTNANFAPLAQKILTPYEDFRKSRHGAVNLYEINTSASPFSDRRVRQALALSIDRERLVESLLEGTAEPALNLIPLTATESRPLTYDVRTARDLLEKAGFPNGENFPPIRLVINRNDTQTRIARSVARMWKQELNLDTTIIVKEQAEMEAVKRSGGFDLIRRGVVFPTVDEMMSLTAVFGYPLPPISTPEVAVPSGGTVIAPGQETRGPMIDDAEEPPAPQPPPAEMLMTENAAMLDVAAIPLYFPISYSLVKPYVRGFEINGLGAPPLKYVSIDSSWQPSRR